MPGALKLSSDTERLLAEMLYRWDNRKHSATTNLPSADGPVMQNYHALAASVCTFFRVLVDDIEKSAEEADSK